MKLTKVEGSKWANCVKILSYGTVMNGKYPISSYWIIWRKRLAVNRPHDCFSSNTSIAIYNCFCLFLIHLIIKDSDIKRIPALFFTSCQQDGKTGEEQHEQKNEWKLTDMDGRGHWCPLQGASTCPIQSQWGHPPRAGRNIKSSCYTKWIHLKYVKVLQVKNLPLPLVRVSPFLSTLPS